MFDHVSLLSNHARLCGILALHEAEARTRWFRGVHAVRNQWKGARCECTMSLTPVLSACARSPIWLGHYANRRMLSPLCLRLRMPETFDPRAREYQLLRCDVDARQSDQSARARRDLALMYLAILCAISRRSGTRAPVQLHHAQLDW